MMVFRRILGLTAGALLLSGHCFGMMFSSPVDIGRIGWEAQSPYLGLPISGASYNDGTEELRDADLESMSQYGWKDPGERIATYVKGTAAWGTKQDALYCSYDISKEDAPLNFGGKENYILSTDAQDKTISRIDSDSQLTIYALYHNYCVSHLQLLGRQKDGKWVLYLDSKKISDKYFKGKDAYK